MIAIGLVLLLVGLLVPIHILFVVGLVLLLVGLLLNVVPVNGSRRRFW